MLTLNKNIRNIIKYTKNIEGWLGVQEGLFLYKLASKLNHSANIVEIGSWKGKSTVWLGSAVLDKNNVKIYAVDPHRGSPGRKHEYGRVNTYNSFQKTIETFGLSEIVVPVRKPSLEAVKHFKHKIDLLFIDGSHRYIDTKNDFFAWKSKVNDAGWIVLHDATVLPGPWKVARKYLLWSPNFQHTGMLGSIIYGRYHIKPNFIDKIFNILINFFTYLFIISYVKMRKIPLASSFKKKLSKRYFKATIKGL